MPYFLTYKMTVGASVTTCFAPNDAMCRFRELGLAGASDIVVSHNGEVLSLAELQELIVPGERCDRP